MKDGWGFTGRAKGKLARVAAFEAEQLAKYGIQAGETATASAAAAGLDRHTPPSLCVLVL